MSLDRERTQFDLRALTQHGRQDGIGLPGFPPIAIGRDPFSPSIGLNRRQGTPPFQTFRRSGLPRRAFPPFGPGLEGVTIERSFPAEIRGRSSEGHGEIPLQAQAGGPKDVPSLELTSPTRRVLIAELSDGQITGLREVGDSIPAISTTTADRQREHAFSLFPDHDGGEMERNIDAFFAKEGLSTKPLLLLTLAEMPQLIQGLADVGYRNLALLRIAARDMTRVHAGAAAAYLQTLGFIVGIRPEDPAEEGLLKFLVAHEKSHSTSRFDDIVYIPSEQDPKFLLARNGLALRNTQGEDEGEALEEAFDTYMAARYVRTDGGLPNGVWGDRSIITLPNGLTIPTIYLWPTQEKDAYYMESASPLAYGLELLVAQQPQLHPAFIQARTSLEGLQEVEGIINGFQPDLYQRLQHLPNNNHGSRQGLEMIQQVVNS